MARAGAPQRRCAASAALFWLSCGWRASCSDISFARDVTPQCSAALREYLLCSAVDGFYTVCGSDGLFNASKTLQKLIGCTEDPSDCSARCMSVVEGITNESVHSPCEAAVQAMHGFSAPINIFTIQEVDKEANVSKPAIMPLPNIKNMGGPTLMSYGEPGHCAEIESAQYCILSGELQTMGPKKSTFALGSCLPSRCAEAELQDFVDGDESTRHMNLKVQCNLVKPLGKAMGASAIIEDKLGWGGVPVYYPRRVEATVGLLIMILVILVLVAFMCVGTAIDWRRESKRRVFDAAQALRSSGIDTQGMESAVPLTVEMTGELPPLTCVEGFFQHWSVLRNGRSLLRTRPAEQNPFACMDAIRVFSMTQVILGHSFFFVLTSAGYSNMEQFDPPDGLLGSFWFQIIPGCFYGVDSFFVMSGFLCAYGLEKKVFNRRENRQPMGFSIKYAQFVLLRWLRLIPAEMFCIAFVMTILPWMGTGIMWNWEKPNGSYCYESAGANQCSKYWWTNLLFLQDVDHYAGKCFAHTWYLANDFQLYLTAPFFGLAYSIDRRIGWGLLGAGLFAGVISPMIITASNHWVPEIIAGSTKGFDQKFYMKPWCRCPAFFVGIALGWAWPALLERHKGRHLTAKARAASLGWALLGLALCFAATFGRMAFFQCDFLSCSKPETSPVPMFLQYVWAGFGILSWCVGLAIVMTLCFQSRFLPLVQEFMNLPLWQPIAKLSYSAYLIHTSILILDFCQRDSPVTYSPSTFFFNFVSFTTCSLFAAMCVYMLVEKPCSNLQMKVFGGGGE